MLLSLRGQGLLGTCPLKASKGRGGGSQSELLHCPVKSWRSPAPGLLSLNASLSGSGGALGQFSPPAHRLQGRGDGG